MNCQICNTENVEKEMMILCENCSNYSCLECLISNKKDCCFCGKITNIYDNVFNDPIKNNYLNIIENFFIKKLNNITDNFFPEIIVAIELFQDLVFFNFFKEKELVNILYKNLYKIILAKITKNNFINEENNIKFLLKICNGKFNKFRKVVLTETYSKGDSQNSRLLETSDYDFFHKKICFYKTVSEKKFTEIYPVVIKKINLSQDDQEQLNIVCTLFMSFLNFLTNNFILKIYNEEKGHLSCNCNNLNCLTCNTIYCVYCLSDEKNHNCLKKTELRNIKLCPFCKILIEKKEGCDDMWCLSCKNFFSWRQGVLRYDSPHNPDNISYIRNTPIKKLLLESILEEDNGFLNEENFILEFILNVKKISEHHINIYIEYLIYKIFKQLLTVKIITMDKIENRTVKDIKNIINLCDIYKNIMTKYRAYYGHEILNYSTISINTKFYQIVYYSE